MPTILNAEDFGIGLYDSDTNASLSAIAAVDISDLAADQQSTILVFSEAKRGRLVQLRLGSTHIHYFFDEAAGAKMIAEDAWRYGMSGDAMLDAISKYAPPGASTQ